MAEQVVLDIKIPREEFIKAEKAIDDLTRSTDALKDSNKALQKQNKELEKEQKALNDAYKTNTISLEEYDEASASITKTITLNNKTISKNKIQIQENNRERNSSIKLLKAEEGSRNQLRARIAQLNKEYNEQNLTTKEGAERASKLAAELKELRDTVNDTSKAAGSFKDNIGNYANSVKDALAGTGLLDGQLGEIFTTLTDLSSSIKSASGGVGGLTGKFKLLKVAILSTGIGAIVIALGTLLVALQKTQAGTEKLRIGIAQIKATIDVVIGRIARLGNALIAVFAGDLTKAAELASSAFDDIGEEIEQAVDRAVEAEKATIAYEKTIVVLTKSLAELNKQTEINNAIADDATRSFREREEAAEQARLSSEKAAQAQLALASEELRIFQIRLQTQQQAGTVTTELLQEEADLIGSVIEAQKELQLTVLDNERQRRELTQDRLERDLDILIDGFDNVKSINERIIADDQRTFEERKKVLDDTKELFETSFNEQIATIQQFTDETIDANDLISESDANALNDKIRNLELSEIIEGRLLEVIRDRRTALQDLAEVEQDLTKEEISRREEAIRQIQEIEDQQAVDRLKSAEAVRDALIEIEQNKTEQLLQDETLLAEERELIRLQSLERINELENDFLEKEKERQAELIAAYNESLSKISDLGTQLIGEQNKSFEAFADLTANIAQKTEFDAATTADTIGSLLQGVTNSVKSNNTQQIAALQKKYEADLALAEGDDAKKEELRKRFIDAQNNLLQEQFKSEKRKAVLDINIQTAIAVAKAVAASPTTGGLPFSAIAGAIGAGQLAVVASQPTPPKIPYREGGTIVNGPSHASGGVQIFGDNGQYFGEVEGGEMMTVLKKNATQALMLSRLNESFGGRAFAQGGTIVNNNTSNVTNSTVDANELASAIGKIKISVDVDDITTAQNQQIEVLNNASL